MEQFQRDIVKECQDILPAANSVKDDPHGLLNKYESGLLAALNRYAPREKRQCRKEWNNVKEVQAAGEKRHWYEHTWRNTGLEVHSQIYVKPQKATVRCIAKMKCECYQASMEAADNNTLVLLVRSLETTRSNFLPKFNSVEEGCTEFAEYFSHRIQKIRICLVSIRLPDCIVAKFACFQNHLSCFEPTTDGEIWQLFSQRNQDL